MGPTRTKNAFFTFGRLVYHQSKLLRNAANQRVCWSWGKAVSTESTAQSPSEWDLPSHFRQLVDSFTINQNYYEINVANHSVCSNWGQGFSTESIAQFPWESNLPTHVHQLVDSFTINQNYYQITRTSEFVVIEVKVFQLRALPNFGRNRTWQRISVNW